MRQGERRQKGGVITSELKKRELSYLDNQQFIDISKVMRGGQKWAADGRAGTGGEAVKGVLSFPPPARRRHLQWVASRSAERHQNDDDSLVEAERVEVVCDSGGAGG